MINKLNKLKIDKLLKWCGSAGTRQFHGLTTLTATSTRHVASCSALGERPIGSVLVASALVNHCVQIELYIIKCYYILACFNFDVV